ncbi:MAG: VWA domain-containing protein [Lentisphaeria bacterium]|nr:VWA domain-containing protein [Lentisphaeria bacterium]
MKLSKYILVSMGLSLLLHLLLLHITSEMLVGAHATQEGENRRFFERFLPVQILPEPELPKPEPVPEKDKESVFPDPETMKKITSDMQREVRQLANVRKIETIFQKDNLLDVPKTRFRLEGVDKQRPPGLDTNADEKPVLATAPRPEIIEIDYASLPAPRQALKMRTITPRLERESSDAAMLPSLTPHGPLTSSAGGAYGLSVKSGFKPSFGAPEIEVPELKQETGAALSLQDSAPSPLEVATDLSATRGNGAGLPLPFDGFVDIQVRVIKDQVGNSGYFQVDIIPNANSDALKDIAKDSLFLIDHSTSISPQKLSQFKLATREALSCLNPKDRFNVVAFTSTTNSLFQGYQAVNARNLAEADQYVAGLWRGGMTDVFGGVAPYVKNSNGDKNRPLNIFLLTDGRSTVNIHEPPAFLRQISAFNPGNVSIYPFSAGTQANRQLLDFLGYLNRGGKCHVDEIEKLHEELVNYISTHSSLIIMDLKYTAEGPVSQEIFPRSLPHLYRNESLRLFGRFRNIEDELVLTLAGKDADLKIRDLIFRRRYRECPPASKELPREWAGQKILFLLALRNSTEDQRLIARYNAEINALTREYGVYTPY